MGSTWTRPPRSAPDQITEPAELLVAADWLTEAGVQLTVVIEDRESRRG
ncbi:hypothetical protein ACWGQ5_53560 [Streptomyces sp. NPDC055722]